jgi:hypothetical protein
MNWRGSDGSGRDFIEILSRQIPEVTEEKYEISARIAVISLRVRTWHLQIHV